MDHGGEAARSTELGMAGAVQGSQANIGTGTFDDFEPTAAAYHNSAEFHREPGPGVVYANIGASWQQLGPVDMVLLIDPQLPGGVVPVHHSHFYSALQPRPGAGRGVVLAALLPGGVGAMYNGDYALQLRPGAGHSEVLVDLLPDDVGHGPQGEVFVGLLPGGGVVAYDDYGYNAPEHRPGAGHGEVLVDLLPDGAGHGEVFISPLSDGVGAVFDNSGNFAQQTPGTGRAEGIVGAFPNLGAGYGGSRALADDLGAAYNNLGMVAEHLRRLLPFAGIGACSVAVSGLAAGPGSPAVAFHLFALLLGGLLLVMLHVLRV